MSIKVTGLSRFGLLEKIDTLMNHSEGSFMNCYLKAIELLNNEPDYVGSYYHLAKLYERNQQTDAAIEIYTKGMEVAKKLKDNHNLNELRSAYDNLVD
jgi:tetratricopeptide (TPR) repeat protein